MGKGSKKGGGGKGKGYGGAQLHSALKLLQSVLKGGGKGSKGGSSSTAEGGPLYIDKKLWGTEKAVEEQARLSQMGCWKCNWADCGPSTRGSWNRRGNLRCFHCHRLRAEAKNPPDASVGPQRQMQKQSFADAVRGSPAKGNAKGGMSPAEKPSGGSSTASRSNAASSAKKTPGPSANGSSSTAEAKITYPAEAVKDFWAKCREPPTAEAADLKEIIQRQLGSGRAGDNRILVARVKKAQALLDVCLEYEAEDADDVVLARKALESAKRDLAKATPKSAPANFHAVNAAKEAYLAQQVNMADIRKAGKEKSAKRATDAIAALQSHLLDITQQIKMIQEKQVAAEVAWDSYHREQDLLRDKVVAELEKKAAADLQLRDAGRSSTAVVLKIANDFECLSCDDEIVDDIEALEEEQATAEAETEAHRVLKWDPALLPDLAEQARHHGPLVFLQELFARIRLWSHSSAMIVTYGEFFNGFSNGTFENHMTSLKQILGAPNWSLIYPNVNWLITEYSVMPLEMRYILMAALSKIQEQLMDTNTTCPESFETVIRKSTTKKKLSKKK